MLTYKFFSNANRRNVLTLRLTNNTKKCSITLGLHWSQEDIDDALSPNPRSENLPKRAYLLMRSAILDSIKIELQDQGRIDEDITVIRDMVKQRLLISKSPSEKIKKGTFMAFFKKHIEKYDKRNTRESNEYTISVIYKFRENVDEINFEDINYAWLSDLEIWMKQHNLSQNTRKIHFGNIRTAMREAYKRELTDVDPFRRFTFKPAKTRKRSMDVELLRELFDYPVESFAEIYRDMFKLSFMLIGINTIDLYNLKGVTRSGRIEYTRSKTQGLLSILVEPEAMELINKYRGKDNLLCLAERWGDHRNFRHQMNAAIRRIGKAQGKGVKDKQEDGPFAEVTSYWARHSWATIAADLDIPDATISMALGHSGENRVTDIYIRRNQRKVDAANRRVLDWVLYGRR